MSEQHKHESTQAFIHRLSRAIGHLESVKKWWKMEGTVVKF